MGLVVQVLEQEQPGCVVAYGDELQNGQPPEVVAVQSVQVVQVHYGQGAYQGCKEVGTIVTGEAVGHALEGDEGPGEAEPVGASPAHFLDRSADVLVDSLVDDSLLNPVNIWVSFLEVISLPCFFFDEVEGHADVLLALGSEVQEAVGTLQLVQIPFDVVVVVNIFLQLGSPLTTLLLVHEVLTVHVVEVDAHLRSVRITLSTVGFLSGVDVEIKPKFLNLNSYVRHVFSKFTHLNKGLNSLAHYLRVNNLNVNLIIIVQDIKLDALVVDGILVNLRRRVPYINPITRTALRILLLQSNFYKRLGHCLRQVSHLYNIEKALLQEL